MHKEPFVVLEEYICGHRGRVIYFSCSKVFKSPPLCRRLIHWIERILANAVMYVERNGTVTLYLDAYAAKLILGCTASAQDMDGSRGGADSQTPQRVAQRSA